MTAALYAAGVRIFSRSFKYHRPRGLFCLSGRCSHCLMRVDGVPNVRICQQRVRPEMRVESQNAWPSLKLDAAAAAGFLSPLIRPGFQYRRFIRARGLYHLWEGFLRRMAGIGALAEPDSVAPSELRRAQVEILIVGGGVAGMSAALAAADSGAAVMLVEREDELGGRRLYDTGVSKDQQSGKEEYLFEHVRTLARQVQGLRGCRIMKQATAFGWYEEGILAVMAPGEIWELRPRQTILANGSYETPTVFDNNDLPGIFSAEGVQRLMHRDFLRPGNLAAVAAQDDRGYTLALQLAAAGVQVVGVVDRRTRQETFANPALRQVREQAIAVFHGHRLKAALGRRHVRGALFEPLVEAGPTKKALKLRCDVLCVAGGRIPANELAFQRTCRGEYLLESPQQYTRAAVRDKALRAAPDLYVVGGAAGCHALQRAALEGSIAGLHAALQLGRGGKQQRLAMEQALEQLSGR